MFAKWAFNNVAPPLPTMPSRASIDHSHFAGPDRRSMKSERKLRVSRRDCRFAAAFAGYKDKHGPKDPRTSPRRDLRPEGVVRREHAPRQAVLEA
eukprot:scaffold9317_cov76-Phaeocystis_antarctica.AAC.2